MPKHQRVASNSHNRFANPMPVTLAPSPMYTVSSQPRMSLANTYYAAGPSTSSPMTMQPQAQPQQPTYESYSTASAGPAVGLSPPVQHRASSGAWTPQDDQQLLNARMQGLNWAQIQATYFPTKTPNACRKRHERLMERKGADDWDNQKLQRLAKEYMSMRKEIWSGLAARTGEKWTVVEQKCMSNGIKNLQSAARAANRRDRLESGGGHISGYDDDSGISGMGLTPVDELDPSYSSPETTSSAVHSAHSTASNSAVAYQHLQPHHSQMAALNAQSMYGMNTYNAYGHGYSSSVSSNASAAGHGYGLPQPGTAPTGNSQSSSPFMNGQRQPSVDMGIPALINRTGGGL